MSPIMVMTFAYLCVGLVTTIGAWANMRDEIEMSISADLDDESDRPALRTLVTLVFVMTWPLVLGDVLRRR